MRLYGITRNNKTCVRLENGRIMTLAKYIKELEQAEIQGEIDSQHSEEASEIIVTDHQREYIPYRDIRHTVTVKSVYQITLDDIEDIAIKVSYHPAGYGISKKKIIKQEGITTIVQWVSQDSCD